MLIIAIKYREAPRINIPYFEVLAIALQYITILYLQVCYPCYTLQKKLIIIKIINYIFGSWLMCVYIPIS